MAPKPNQLVKSSDFENFEYSILLANTTTQSEIHDGRKPKITQMFEKAVVLQLPVAFCAVGNMITIFLYPGIHGVNVTELPKKEEDMKGAMMITGKVVEKKGAAKGDKAGTAIVCIEFYQFTKQQWDAFRRKFGKLQKEVDRVFKVIKG